jgi:outer membrane protein TolC
MANRLKNWRAAFFPTLSLSSFLIVGCSKSQGPPPAKTD